MENYLVFIMSIALVGMFLDCLTARYPVLQRQLYRLFFVVIYVLFVVRYYYGPDIRIYVPHFERIAAPSYLFYHPEKMYFEWGYEMLCSVVKALGGSFWWLNTVITTLYFVALGCLFRSLKRHQLFAFSCVILLDYNLIYAQIRECLAVSFFIFMILCLQNRKYLWALVMATLTIVCHKSGFIPVCLTMVCIPLLTMREHADVYRILAFMLFLLLLIPVSKVDASLISHLPLPSGYMKSIRHHMLLGRQLQIVAVVYLAVLFIVIYLRTPKKDKYNWMAIEFLTGMLIVVIFYQYFNFLMRLRSFFVPLIAYYVVTLVNDEERVRQVPYSKLVTQSVALVLMVYFVHTTISYDRMAKTWHSPVARASTVFELRHHSQKAIRDRQMRIAKVFWEEDYLKDQTYRVK